jgi:uncharacterized protein (TIGR02646 family)
MRVIHKGTEPRSLTEHRASTHATYDNYQGKDELRQSLVVEQGAICCYGMRRIRPDERRMKIEHWRCQHLFPGNQLDYDNLLGACLGGMDRPPKLQHCDTRKGDLPLSRNPANPAHRIEDLVHFLGDGRLESPDGQLNRDIENVLNLNNLQLKSNRKAVLDGFLESLPKQGELGSERLRRWIGEWSGQGGPGELREYCQVVVYWLQKRLARARS